MTKVILILSLVFSLHTCVEIKASEHRDGPLQVYQGWSEKELQTIRHLDEGAQIMPWRWFSVLEESHSTKKFIKSLSDFGFIPDPSGHSLPVGVTLSEDARTAHLYKEKLWVGVNCTACHTGLIEINGRSLLIEGNQSLFRIQSFENELLKSVQKTLSDPDKFNRFAKNLKADNRAELKNLLQSFYREFGGWTERNHRFFDKDKKLVEYGPGRLDGLGGATNDFSCYLSDRMGDPELTKIVVNPINCRPSNPPVSIPYLWGTAREQFAQWNVDVHHSLARNYGASMAGYGKNWVESDGAGGMRFKSTAHLDNLDKFNELYKKLLPPRWEDLARAKLVAPLNDSGEKSPVQVGRKLYQNHCQHCHAIQPESTAPNKFGNSFWEVKVIPARELGMTDEYLLAENKRRVLIHPLLRETYKKMFGEGAIDSLGMTSASAARGFLLSATLGDLFKERKFSPQEIAKRMNCRESVQQKTLGFKARSLEGVVWSAPYLHNGSVPTLFALLTKEEERAKKYKKFYLGCRRYNVKTAGFDCDKNDRNVFLYDTSLFGNSNRGHNYGTDLSDEQKFALIEYMKSLEQPDDPLPLNPHCN